MTTRSFAQLAISASLSTSTAFTGRHPPGQVPTLTFERLFAFLVLGHGRRQLLWFEVTRHPTAEWLARQITEAFPWTSAPSYLVRDNDRVYGDDFRARVRAMGIPYVECLIGTV